MKYKYLAITIMIVTVLCCGLLLVGCDKPKNAQYDGNQEYEVVKSEEFNAQVYQPKGYKPMRGLIFYVGTVMPPKAYDNLAVMLATAGYYVAFPKLPGNFTYFSFIESEEVLDKKPNIKFAVGGHSQGGGAAAKRLLQTNYDGQTVGGYFLSPLFYQDTNMSNWSKPALLIEAEFDKVLSQSMKNDAKSKMPKNTSMHIILGGNHMGYSDMTFPTEDIIKITPVEQQQQTANLMIEFLSGLQWE